MKDVRGLVDHLFRKEAGKMVSYLTRLFGLGRLNLAEDVVQDTLCQALQAWSIHGLPDNPSAWLMRVARNLSEARFLERKLKTRMDSDP